MESLTRQDPATIGPFRLLARLGSGAMGFVYLGELPSGRRVAIKVVHRHLTFDPQFRHRFEREVTAARAVGGFWTAAIVDADPFAARPWLASEFIVGPTLEDAVNSHGPLPVDAARSVALGLVEALIAIHHVPLLHRDLKPSNILLAADGPRVIDFGIARAFDDVRLTMPDSHIGTPQYMSPEQANADPNLTPASDVFALGGVMVFTLTGHPAFTGTSLFAVLRAVTERDPDLTGVPSALLPAVRACLEKRPADRPTTAELLQLLTAPAEPPAAGRRRDKWWLRQT